MRLTRTVTIVAAAMLSLSAAAASAAAPRPRQACAGLLARSAAGGPARSILPKDLIALRDIGEPTAFYTSVGLGLSPDGRQLAFPLRRADPASNSYCLGIVLFDLVGHRSPRLLDVGRAMVRQPIDVRGTLGPPEFPAVIRPKWSPDGQWIAFLKNVGGIPQVWRVRRDGTDGRVIPSRTGPALDFAWSGNRDIVIASWGKAGLASAVHAKERLTGFRYDARFLPMMGQQPYPLRPALKSFATIAANTGQQRAVTAAERRLFDPVVPDGAERLFLGRGGERAWVEPVDARRFGGRTRLRADFGKGASVQCGPDQCDRIDGLWWLPGGRGLAFVRREGWAASRTGVYVWAAGQIAPSRILVTDDVLLDCVNAAMSLLCGHEGAQRPRTIVDIGLRTGTLTTVFDPNPDFAGLRLGRVERLHWLNDLGLETYGDLVYPVNFEAGRTYPTIVTTYTTRGFLRGATGDEYPIQLFADRGYVVLSFARPTDIGVDMAGVTGGIASDKVATRDWADRRSVQSAIEAGLQLITSKGIVDPTKVGITGLSDGATSVQFALLNSGLFAAAAMSSCCTEPDSMLAGLGLPTADYFRQIGYPELDDTTNAFWSPMSFVRNARRMSTPLLLQLGSGEYRAAISSFTALRAYHQPVDMYVYPDEGHVKLEPAHRLAVYQRNLAWFDFWLKRQKDHTFVDATELAVWEDMRSQRAASDAQAKE